MTSSDRASTAWRRPDGGEPSDADPTVATRAFTDADLQALRELLREDAARRRPPPKPRTTHRAPPNLGGWLALVLIVAVLAATAVGSLTLWLYVR